MWGRVRYRLWQVWAGWRDRVTAADREEVRRWLPPAAYALWLRQSPRDQAHALRVLRLLRTVSEDPVLLRAALLHDVGKAQARLRVWHRALWVLLERFPPLRRRLVAARGWRRPFWVLAEHPRLGAEWAEAAGCAREVCWLIAHHQDETPTGPPEEMERLRLLRWADKRS